ncbi:MAG: hypothetical protein DI626_05530 [Micavibrio aeruginosavorus]|uniref:Type IV secretion protein DotA n=1 Tax=Micavibrio aeruginosavorus TaxID=349221 RepID=A0A2W5BYI6_9BACT|nr:MAG: hypothetical protein DI626_05530 [Micavibrio aeruginosavorus]
MVSGSRITQGQVLRIVVLPGIFPRLKRLFSSGFFMLPYFVMLVFNTVRIIPDGHPFLRSENIGKYSLIKALSEAATHVPFNKQNADKVFFFTMILSGIVMLFMQVFLCILAIFTLPARAESGVDYSKFFSNPNDPKADIAFRLLDLVFGVKGSTGAGYFGTDHGPTAFHTALHALFQFYSYGILLIGSFVIIYLATTIVIETARWGVPFGQRFNKAWAPIRLVLFFGLLLPASSGLNMAQYILLDAARLGSNVATNAWLLFDKTSKTPYIETADNLIAQPTIPPMNDFLAFMAISRTCSWAEGRHNGRDIRPYFVFKSGSDGAIDLQDSTPAFSEMVKKADGGTINIRFGEKKDIYNTQTGTVYPFCGELQIPVVDQAQPGAAIMQQAYVDQITCLWSGRGGAASECSQYSFSDMGKDFTSAYSTTIPRDPYPDLTPYIGERQKMQFLILINQDLNTSLENAVKKQRSEGTWNNDVALNMGWAGAGIWFNKIAEQNGALTGAVHSKPIILHMPTVMENIYKQKAIQSPQVPILDAYNPVTGNNQMILTGEEMEIATVLNQVYKQWAENNETFIPGVPESRDQTGTGNIIIDTINGVMGTQGLFDMCRNKTVHPLASLSSLGKGLIDHSIRGFAVAAGVGIGGGFLKMLGQTDIANATKSITKFFLTFAGIGLMLGFILFYVLPFMPFIYFFFAVMTWVKTIFEAMVAMPLWALAHLRIDGDGMPGSAAEGGYFYILEIFLRPVIIIISFLGGILIFAALTRVLNETFYLALSNLSGHSGGESTTGCFKAPGSTTTGVTPDDFRRGPIDEFFYSVIYAITVYLMAVPCFKLVDAIPDNIMRWMGSGIQTFGSQDGDPADSMMKYVAGGAGLTGSKLKEGFGKSLGLN